MAHLLSLLPCLASMLVLGAPTSTTTAAAAASPTKPLEVVPVIVPKKLPPYANPLSPYVASLSIEQDRWTDWAGPEIGKPNVFVNNALQNIMYRTGTGVWFRVGANSEDRALLDLSLQVGNQTRDTPTDIVPYPESKAIFMGRDWYALSQNLPANTPFTWGINLKSLHVSETVAQAQHLSDTFQGSRAGELAQHPLKLVEIGNEPNFYSRKSVPLDEVNVTYSNWNALNYTQTWTKYAKAVAKVMDFDHGLKFQAGAFAIHGMANPWNAISSLGAGLVDDDEIRGLTSTWASHFYNGGYFGKGGLPGTLNDKTYIRVNASSGFAEINAVKQSGLDFVYGEGNSFSNHGTPGVSNTAENALWGIDFTLQNAAFGMSRFHFHNGVGYRYNFIQPVAGADDGLNRTDAPHILPFYHTFLVLGEAAGNSGGDVRVAELGVGNSSTATYTPIPVSAYGIWENGRLARAVFINSQLYLPEMGAKPALNVSLLNWGGGYATVKRLEVPQTNAFHGLTWAGQDFDTADAKPTGEVKEEVLNGTSLVLPASEVALVCFK